MVFKSHTRFWEGWESEDDDERPGRPTEIGDAIIDKIRHAVQEGGHAPFLSFSSLGVPIVHLNVLIFVFQSKLYVLLMWISKKQLQNFPYGNPTFLYGKEKHRCYATSFLNFTAPGHTTSPYINEYCDLVFNSIAFMFTLSIEIISNIFM